MYKQILLHTAVKDEQRRMEYMKKNIEYQLKRMPKGAIHERNGRYYHIYRENGKQKMLAIKDDSLLEDLKAKRKLKNRIAEIKERADACKVFLSRDRLYDAKYEPPEMPERYRGGCAALWPPGDVDPEIWGAEEYEHNPMPIEKPSQTSGGRLVRSKSEAFIGNELERVPLMYRYEPKLIVMGEVFYPDFMFVLPNTRMVVIWEHFGRMDDPAYVKRAMHKLEMYSKAGWMLGRNLFITYETEDTPFSFPGAKAKMQEILSCDTFVW